MLPRTSEEMRGLTAVKPWWAEQFGPEVLGVLNEADVQAPVDEAAKPARAAAATATNVPVAATAAVTGPADPEQPARKRSRRGRRGSRGGRRRG